MEKLRNLRDIAIISLLPIVVISFYWYELRPQQIIKECHHDAKEAARKLLKKKAPMAQNVGFAMAAEKNMYLSSDYKKYYQGCLRSHGLNIH